MKILFIVFSGLRLLLIISFPYRLPLFSNARNSFLIVFLETVQSSSPWSPFSSFPIGFLFSIIFVIPSYLFYALRFYDCRYFCLFVNSFWFFISSLHPSSVFTPPYIALSIFLSYRFNFSFWEFFNIHCSADTILEILSFVYLDPKVESVSLFVSMCTVKCFFVLLLVTHLVLHLLLIYS